mgnify:CR=1 FL=1
MQLFYFLSYSFVVANGFIPNIPTIRNIYLRNNIISRNAIYTSYNPMENNNNVTKRFMIIIPDNNDNSTHLRPGYPREAFRNITYPQMNDVDLDEEIGDITQTDSSNHPYNQIKNYFPNSMKNSYSNWDGTPIKINETDINNNEDDDEIEEAIKKELQDALGNNPTADYIQKRWWGINDKHPCRKNILNDGLWMIWWDTEHLQTYTKDREQNVFGHPCKEIDVLCTYTYEDGYNRITGKAKLKTLAAKHASLPMQHKHHFDVTTITEHTFVRFVTSDIAHYFLAQQTPQKSNKKVHIMLDGTKFEIIDKKKRQKLLLLTGLVS